MRFIAVFFVLMIPGLLSAQFDYTLFDKYFKFEVGPNWLSPRFFHNNANNKIAFYKSIDLLLASNSNSQIRLDYKYESGHYRTKTTINFDTAGQRIYKSRTGLFSFLKRKIQIDTVHIILKNDKGLITSICGEYWSEFYTYDSTNNMIMIERKYNPYGRDSTGFMLFCLSTANKWVGEYDSTNQLIRETTYWDDGGEYSATHSFENGVLIVSENFNKRTHTQEFKKYFYADGILRQEQVFDPKGKLIEKRTYAWTVVPFDARTAHAGE